MVAGKNHCAGTEEEQRLEPRVGEEVEHAGFTGDEADSHDHVAELGERGVGEDFFDVVLLGGHQRGGQGGESAGPGDDLAGDESGHDVMWNFEREVNAEKHVDTGRDHGGGVNECGNRSGAFHRIGQPDVERELRGLADRPAEDAEQRHRKGGGKDGGISGLEGDDAFTHFAESEGSGNAPDHEDTAVGDESFLRGICSGVFLIPVTDEQIGTHADQLPKDEGHDEVVRQHDAGHGEHEERETGEVAGFRLVVLHVGQREDMDEHADAGDHDHHAGR